MVPDCWDIYKMICLSKRQLIHNRERYIYIYEIEQAQKGRQGQKAPTYLGLGLLPPCESRSVIDAEDGHNRRSED